MTKPLPVHGADISHHQGTVDLAKARAAGLQWIYHKATQGKGYTDDRYTERRNAARRLGLPFGAYHFAETTSTPEVQAAHFLKVAGIQPGDMRPMLDLENTTGSSFSGMSTAARTAWVGKFVAAVKKATGVEPFIYTPFDLSNTFNCPLWVARYNPNNAEPNTPRPWSAYTIRQFTNGVVGVPNSFPGLGNVDLNTWNGEPKQMLAAFQIGGTTPPVVTPRPTTGGSTVSSTDRMTKIFKAYVGFREGKSGSTWNNDNIFAKRAGFANFLAWCATFLVAGFKEAGLGTLLTTPSPGVDQLSVGFKKAGRWSEYPAVGALMFRGKPSDLNHVGYVYAYDATYAYTIEGNTNTTGSPQGNGVYQLKRARRDAALVGYGYPDYPEGIDSADPAFARVGNPTPAPKPPAPAPAPVLDLLDAKNYPPNGPSVGPHITWLGERLVLHGHSAAYTVGPGPEWGEADRANVESFQKAQGWTGADADGYPGPETLRRLALDPVTPDPTPLPTGQLQDPHNTGWAAPRKVAHKPDGKPYAYGSTQSALERATASGHDAIDLDLTVNVTGKGYINHWDDLLKRDAWTDPLSLMPDSKPLSKMTDEEADRLVSPYGPILSAYWATVLCKRLNLLPCFEAKGHDAHFQDADWWREFLTVSHNAGSDPVIMTLPGSFVNGGIRVGELKLKAANAAGCRTLWLQRGDVPKSVLPYLTYVKQGNKITTVTH